MSDINVTVQDEIVNIDVLDTPVIVEVTNSPGQQGPAGVGVPVGGTTGQVLAKSSATDYATNWVNPSGGTWGSITGTLSNQTDLQNALNAKFDDPTGTTAQYLRGDGSLATFPAIPSGTVSSVGLTMPSAFAVANSPVTSSGTLAVTATGDTTQYIAGDGSLVAFPITGQAGTLVREVRNNSGATITKGTVVYINGALGNRPTIAKAIATSDPTSAQTFGLVQANINNNSNGYIVAFGDLDGLDTSAFTEGAQLYLSSTVLGGYTITKQYAPNHLVYIGVVTRSHPNQGRIEVRIQNGYELDEIHNVSAQTPTNNDGIFYNSTSTLWENKSIATALGYTPVPTTRTITINGVTFDLSADRTYTIAAGISGSGTSGQVTYWSGASAVSGSSAFLWDNTNSRLAIGASTTWNAGIGALSVVNGTSDAPILSLKNTDQNKQVYYASYNNVDKSLQYIVYGSTAAGTIFGQFRANAAVILGYNTPSYLAIGNYENVPLIFGNNNQERFRVTTSGNVSIGTTSDLAVRLGVVGDTLLRGSGASSATTALTVQNSDSINLLLVNNSGYYKLSGANGLFFSMFTTTGGSASISGTNTQFYNYTTTQAATSGSFLFTGDNFVQTSGAVHTVYINKGFAPTSGNASFSNLTIASNINQTGGANNVTRGLLVNPALTAVADFRGVEVTANFNPTSGTGIFNGFVYNPTINQTGGANGITRGLYVNPTLTAAADFRAIETSAGNVLFGSNFFWDNTNGRLGIGTNAPATILDLASSGSRLRFSQSVAGSIFHGIEFATSGVAYASLLGNQNTGEVRLSTNTSYFPTFYSSGAEAMRISTQRNLLIGFTTDQATRLAVSGDTLLRGSGATSATTALTVQNSSSVNLLAIKNNGELTLGIGTGGARPNLTIGSSFSGNLNFTTINFANWDATTFARFTGLDAASSTFIFGGTTINASAKLEIISTTQGFLPPRMTTTQKNAIATPAAGLVVYDTTLGKLCVYTTAWETITSI